MTAATTIIFIIIITLLRISSSTAFFCLSKPQVELIWINTTLDFRTISDD